MAVEQPTRRFGFLAVAFYALVLLSGPFLHHDLACHLKSPVHCTTCVSSLKASGPGVPVTPRVVRAGCAVIGVAMPLTVPPAPVVRAGTDRSPPL
jgi:hypothetical protein